MVTPIKILDKKFIHFSYRCDIVAKTLEIANLENFEVLEIDIYTKDETMRATIKELEHLKLNNLTQVVIKGIFMGKIMDICLTPVEVCIFSEKKKRIVELIDTVFY